MSRTLYFTVPYSWKMAFLKKFSDFLLYILAFFASVKFVSGGQGSRPHSFVTFLGEGFPQASNNNRIIIVEMWVDICFVFHNWPGSTPRAVAWILIMRFFVFHNHQHYHLFAQFISSTWMKIFLLHAKFVLILLS